MLRSSPSFPSTNSTQSRYCDCKYSTSQRLDISSNSWTRSVSPAPSFAAQKDSVVSSSSAWDVVASLAISFSDLLISFNFWFRACSSSFNSVSLFLICGGTSTFCTTLTASSSSSATTPTSSSFSSSSPPPFSACCFDAIGCMLICIILEAVSSITAPLVTSSLTSSLLSLCLKISFESLLSKLHKCGPNPSPTTGEIESKSFGEGGRDEDDTDCLPHPGESDGAFNSLRLLLLLILTSSSQLVLLSGTDFSLALSSTLSPLRFACNCSCICARSR
mmetsp:Transcript_9366/g.15006  ORF Transcript_9366/g.15006 Transcript_9366/m.15006 type:complete len:276 (-) Transcript_9366:1783-2610(-)